MDSMVRILLQRARNEITAARLLFDVSEDKNKKESLHIEEDMTFYSSTISHSYYCIFFSAKAILLTKKITKIRRERPTLTLVRGLIGRALQ